MDNHMESRLTRVKGGEGVNTVLGAGFALQTLSIEPNIPIRELLDKLQKFWNDTVQVICFHFIADGSNQGLAVGQNPLILKKYSQNAK